MIEKIDVLSRAEFVKQTRDIIDSLANTHSNSTFAINGTWGCGKSFVLDLLEDNIKQISCKSKSERKYFVIRYDCWKYDYYQEPLVAMVSAILQSIESNNYLSETEKKAISSKLKIAGTFLLKIAVSVFKEKTDVDLTETYKEAKEAFDQNKSNKKDALKYDGFNDFKIILDDLRLTLDDLAKDYVVVFIMDELDRCLPSYALTVLERLHHLTDGIDNIITIVATDKKQLEKTIEKVYGTNYGNRYLQKFFQFEIELDNGKITEDASKKYEILYSKYKLWKDTSSIPFSDFLNIAFYQMPIREQEHLMKKLNLAHALIWKNEDSIPPTLYAEIILAVLVMKFGFPGKESNPTISDFKKPITSLCPQSKDVFSEFDEAMNDEMWKTQHVKYCMNAMTGVTHYCLTPESNTLLWSVALLERLFPTRDENDSPVYYLSNTNTSNENINLLTKETERIKSFYVLLSALKDAEEI